MKPILFSSPPSPSGCNVAFRKLDSVLIVLDRRIHLKKMFAAPFILAVSFGLTGCLDRTIILKEVDNFNASIQAGADATASYYRQLNEQDRKLYALLLALNPQCRVGDSIESSCSFLGSRSPLSAAQIPEESLQARLALLKVLGKYGKALGDLATDQSSSDFRDNIDTLKGNFIGLESSFKKLSGSSNVIDTSLDSRYITPISSILKVLGQTYIESRQWSAVRNAVLAASPSVKVLLASLQKDLNTASYIVPLNEDAAFSSLVSYYNRNKSGMSLEQRKSVLSEILRLQANVVIAKGNNPADLINDIGLIHDKLVVAAQDNAQPRTISELRGLIESYSERQRDFRAAVLLLSTTNSK
jgi:hypothetical protein